MLIALLYCEENKLAAAALACDQTPYGKLYWEEIHPAQVQANTIFETAYVDISDPVLIEQLLLVGVNEEVDGVTLAATIESLPVSGKPLVRAA